MSLTLGYPSTLGTGSTSGAPFNKIFGHVREVTPQDILERHVDALVLWGGADISPSIYGAEKSERNGGYETPSMRDRIEMDLFQAAQKAGIPTIGICRGAQMICALSGGRLVQDVTNHGGCHLMETMDGRQIRTTSVHHQMMYPFQMPEEHYQMLAWSVRNLSSHYVHDDNNITSTIECEPEVVWFPHTKGLAIQGHPEFDAEDSEFVQYSLQLIQQYVLPEIPQ